MRQKRRVWLVQQGVWEMTLESMPLAIGYLKAVVDADLELSSHYDVRLFNFKGNVSAVEMASRIFREGTPEVLGFSVLGWNFRTFGLLAETYKTLRPDGCVIFGGNHVAHQGTRVFRLFPEVDMVVNGEGEETFRSILKALASGGSLLDKATVAGVLGLTMQLDGDVVAGADQPRIGDLDRIPSPFLTGAIPMLDGAGGFRYDVALMETSRGCPYACAFCYWGGAIGQKIRRFSRDRLREELEFFGRMGVTTVITCDSNFGMLPGDEEFVEDFIKTRERFGYPRMLESSWAKNKSERFRRIVSRMKAAGLQTSFTLALQTLNDVALEGMHRKNMRINEWEELVGWVRGEGLECFAELIWGAPGETYESFLEGYDRLSVLVGRIATYPMLILPNTAYDREREAHSLVTVRGDSDDFEYVLAHKSVSVQENLRMQRFLYWARVVAENAVLKLTFLALRTVVGMTQSQVLLSLDRHLLSSTNSYARDLRRKVGRIVDSAAVAEGVRYFHTDEGGRQFLDEWWHKEIMPTVPSDWTDFFQDLWALEGQLSPKVEPHEGQGVEVIGGTDYFVSPIELRYDVFATLDVLATGVKVAPKKTYWSSTVYHPAGFVDHIDSAEVSYHYRGLLREDLPIASIPA